MAVGEKKGRLEYLHMRMCIYGGVRSFRADAASSSGLTHSQLGKSSLPTHAVGSMSI